MKSRDQGASARSVAAELLARVMFEGAYAAAALSHALDHYALSGKDRGLCTELLYGALRCQPYLLRRITKFGKLKPSDEVLSCHMTIAAYQILFLDRVPVHAAVDEAVGSISSARGARVAGFANAVLRKLAKEAELGRPTQKEAVLESTPSWLRKRMTRDIGEAEMCALLVPAENPRPFLRFARSAPMPAWLDSECSKVPEIPHVFRFDAGGDPRNHAEFSRGAFAVQELGASLVGYAVGAQLGERVLDVCAGRGQKSLILAEAVGPGGKVVATDLHDHKVRALQEEARRMACRIDAEPWDWTHPPTQHWVGYFDRVLVDAPCTGVGTLRRRPEIVRRLQPDAPSRLAELQNAIIEHAAAALRPGGILVLATCSVLDLEGPDQVRRLLETGAFELTSPPTLADPVLRRGLDSVPSSLHLLPGRHGTDGYFLARLRKGA